MRYGSVCGLSQGCWLRIKKVPGRPLRYAVTWSGTDCGGLILGRWISRPVGLFDKTPSRSKSIPPKPFRATRTRYRTVLECHAAKIFLGFLSPSTEVGGLAESELFEILQHSIRVPVLLPVREFVPAGVSQCLRCYFHPNLTPVEKK